MEIINNLLHFDFERNDSTHDRHLVKYNNYIMAILQESDSDSDIENSNYN